jgi:hypothetical protein
VKVRVRLKVRDRSRVRVRVRVPVRARIIRVGDTITRFHAYHILTYLRAETCLNQ